MARFHDLNSCLEIFDKFIGTGTWKTNSANTRMIIAAIRCYMEEHSEEYQERDNYFLRAHIVSPVTEALRALIATQKKVKKATEVQITEKDKELEKKREVIFSRLPDVKLFWDIGKIDEVLDKARDYQSINPGHHIFLIRPEPNWQLFWVNLNGARNALPIPKNMLDILYNLGGKFPAEGSDAHSKLKVCCKESLDDSINIYLFREPLEAKKFASEHPDKHSFYLKCSEQATPAKNYKWGVKALEAAKPEYRSLYLEKGENDSLNYVVTRKGSECRLILQSTRPTVEDPAYDNLNFAYILTTDNRLFYLKRLNDGRLEIQQLELIKDGLAILKKEFEIKKGVFLDSVKLELKEKSRVVVEELRRTQKDILESVANFVPEVPMVKGVINKKDFNSDENWEVLCNALEKGSLPEDPQKEILNNLLEITARKNTQYSPLPNGSLALMTIRVESAIWRLPMKF